MRTLRGSFVALCCLTALTAWGQPPQFEPGHVLVKFRDPEWFGAKVAMWVDGARPDGEVSGIGITRVALSKGRSVQSALAYYRSLGTVEFAEPNYVVRCDYVPNDPMYPNQYAHQKVNSPSAWDVTLGSPSVVIAIVDTGIDMLHPDLQGKIVAGFDFVNNDSDASDDHGHGTHCGGIAAANGNDNIGVCGMAPNCSLMPVKVLDANGSGYLSAVANGITWAVDHGAKVVSMSLGGSSGTTTLQQAVDYAWSNGAVVVAAAGNDGDTRAHYPGYYANCIAVASSDQNDLRSSFSTYGSWVDVAAPGSGILSSVPGGGYEYWSGTSMATPAVAGLAGLLFSHLGAQTTNVIVRQRIEANCDPVGNWVVKGRINSYRALTQAAPPPPVTLTGLSLSPTTVLGGGTSVGTVTLSGAAPANGFVVSLSKNSNVASLPASVTVPSGQTSANFTVNTTTVNVATNVNITASKSPQSFTATLSVTAGPKLITLSSTATQLHSMSQATGTVTISAPAPVGGLTVVLSATPSSLLSMPSSVVIPAGQTSAQFTMSTALITSRAYVAVRASYGGVLKQLSVMVQP